MKIEKVRNNHVILNYDGDGICGVDRSDKQNLPAFFTQSKRGLKKAWESVKGLWTPETTMNDITRLLREQNIKIHCYCAMD